MFVLSMGCRGVAMISVASSPLINTWRCFVCRQKQPGSPFIRMKRILSDSGVLVLSDV